MKQPMKEFMFNHDLRSENGAADSIEDVPDPVDNPAISKAYQDGLMAGRSEAALEQSAVLSQANSAIANQLMELNRKFDQDIRIIEKRAGEIALHFARKLTSNMIDKEPTTLIEAAFIKCLNLAGQPPSLTVRSAPALIEDLKATLSQKAIEIGYRGEIHVTQNPDLSGSSVTVEWSEGGLTFDPERVRAEVEALALSHFQSHDNDTGHKNS